MMSPSAIGVMAGGVAAGALVAAVFVVADGAFVCP